MLKYSIEGFVLLERDKDIKMVMKMDLYCTLAQESILFPYLIKKNAYAHSIEIN